jgi:hypothetical protein
MNTNVLSSDSDSFQSIILQTLKSAQSVGSEVYEKGKELGKSAVDTLQKEIPEVISQLLKWEFAYHLIWALFSLLVIVSFILAANKLRKVLKLYDSSNFEHFLATCGIIFCLVICVPIFGVGVMGNISTCVKIQVAPKIFLLEYTNGLIKGGDYNNHNH